MGFILFLLLLLFYNLSQFPFSAASADVRFFGLRYDGGKIMTEPIIVNIIWFGKKWDRNNQAALRNAIYSLSPVRYQNNQESEEVPTLGDWWEIVRQYHDGSKNSVSDVVNVGSECYYTGRELQMTAKTVLEVGKSVFNETAIKGFQGNLTCSKTFDLNDGSIYHVVFSSNVKFTEGKEEVAFRELCRGKLSTQVSNGMSSVDIIWAREPFDEDDQCSTYFRGTSFLGPPNDDEKMDSLIGHMLVNIAEVATNKDGKGWKSNDGNELTVSSSCASVVRQNDADGPPLFSDSLGNYSFNTVGLNGYRYILRYIWDQNVRNCALKLSERCSTKVFHEPNGLIKSGIIVNHMDGLQPYPPNQKCQWKVEYQTAKFISFTLSMTAVEDDRIKLCEHGSHPRCQSMRLNRNNYGNSFKVRGSKAVVKFDTDDQVPFGSRGWELNYSVGICDGAEDIYNRVGTVGYTSPGGSSSYTEGVNCQWILHGKPGTLVTLNFTQINITKDFDFVAVFNGSMWEKANFSGSYSGSDLPQLNLTGKVTIAFVTQTNNGKGWSANFHIASPVDPNEKKLLVAIIVASALAIFSIALLVFVLYTKNRKKNMTKLEKDLLFRAGIKWDEIIGEGTTSIVYKAISTDGTVMAVKRPRYVVSQQKLEEDILARASSHPNIITLMGYGEDTIRGRCLVFEYMSNGSLRKHLEENGEEIDWEKRLDIAIQISKAIQMLHTYMMPPVYHGNITSDNVLINNQYIAKLAGFGTANYCTSFYTSLGMPLEMENDICNLGLLLVELLRGEKAVFRNNYGSSEYSEEINQLIFGQDCLDRRLIIPEEETKSRGLAKLGEIAKWCLSEYHGIEREVTTPKIGDVLSALKQVKQSF